MSYSDQPLPVGGPDTAMTDQQRASQTSNQEPNGGARGQRFENQLSRVVESATSKSPVVVLNGPMTTVTCHVGITIAQARALQVLVHAARVTVRTRGSGPLADALARLDEASPR